MKYEFHGISDTEEDECKSAKLNEGFRCLPSQDLHRYHKKKHKKHKKREKELRNAVKKLITTVNSMQTEIDRLRNYDKDGFRILRRKRVEW